MYHLVPAEYLYGSIHKKSHPPAVILKWDIEAGRTLPDE
jgi:hypothetical protein